MKPPFVPFSYGSLALIVGSPSLETTFRERNVLVQRCPQRQEARDVIKAFIMCGLASVENRGVFIGI